MTKKFILLPKAWFYQLLIVVTLLIACIVLFVFLPFTEPLVFSISYLVTCVVMAYASFVVLSVLISAPTEVNS
ncbi:MAG: hypothetical protein ACTSO3_16800 [Candidatus Heimdallarchaeaceae archaeon]